MISPHTAMRRRACAFGPAPRWSAPIWTRCSPGSNGPMARSRFRPEGAPMTSVLIADELSPRAVEIFGERGIDTEVRVGLKPTELAAALNGHERVAGGPGAKVTKDVMAAAKHLTVVGRAGIGVDNIDVPPATQRGIVVMNTPHGNSITTAEHAIAMMMALARQ